MRNDSLPFNGSLPRLEAAALDAHHRGLTMGQFEREHPGMLRCEEPTSMAVLVTAWLRLCALVNTGKVDESMALPE